MINAEKLNLQEFHDLCAKVAVTTKEDVLRAFQMIDFNNDGWIDRKELIEILTETGDKLTLEEVDDFLESFDVNEEGRFDYKECVTMVIKRQEESYRAAERRYENFAKAKGSHKRIVKHDDGDDDGTINESDLNDDEDDKRQEGKLWVCRSKLPVLEKPKNFEDRPVCRRFGSFYFGDDGDVESHRFVMETSRETLAWVSVEPHWTEESDLNRLIEKKDSHMDVTLFVLTEQGKLVSYSHDKGAGGKSCFAVELKMGRYRLVPYTSGVRFKSASGKSSLKGRKSSPKGVRLVARMGESYLITTAFRATLSRIFKAFDSRGCGLMNKKDFELFTKMTCGDDEELQEEDWSIVLERVQTSQGQITEQGFIELHELDAMDSFGEEADFWDTLYSLGYDQKLQLVKASQYVIEVYTEFGDANIDVEKITTFSNYLQQPIIDLVKSHGEKIKSKMNKNVVVHVLMSEADAFVVVENESSRTLVVTVDCTKSQNLMSHRDSLNYTSKVSAKSSSIFHHLLPVRDRLEWFFRVNERIEQ